MISFARILCFVLLVVVLTAGSQSANAFVDKTAALGIAISPEGGGYGHGCAFVDLDSDGMLELYATQFIGQTNVLFKYQKQSGTYVDIAGTTGCADGLDGRGVAFADYDNDGDQDFFVANEYGANRLFRNDGTGHFSEVAAAVGMSYSGHCHSAAWGDYDNDGWVDLFVCNRYFPPTISPNLLYHNNQDGTFTEVGASAGVDEPTRPALACTWFDYDEDGDVDLYIAYDKGKGNRLFRNNMDGTFTDVTSESLIDSGPTDLVLTQFDGSRWLPMDGMGIAVADYDDNGYLDLFISNNPPGGASEPSSPGGNALLKNMGNGTFTEVSAPAGVRGNKRSWGAAFIDYDNDGDDDIYVVAETGTDNAQNMFFRNNSNGTFTDVAAALGVDNAESSYGLTTGDYNDDGFVDMFVNNQGGPSVFYENVPNGNAWVKIRLIGTVSNRDGLGAKVTVTRPGLVQTIDCRGGSSYLSNLSRDVEFGLGNATNINTIEIRWPSGIVDTWNNRPVKKFYVATEGSTLDVLPVLISRFDGTPGAGGIELSWALESDEPLRGYRVYRQGPRDPGEIEISGLLDVGVRSYVDAAVMPGVEYDYTLMVEEADGGQTRSQTVRVRALQPGLSLAQNHPNPFNPTTRIEYTLAEAGPVELSVYDVSGALVATLVDERRPAGLGAAVWNGTDAAGRAVASGLYFYSLRAGNKVLTRKMILLK